MKTKEEYIERLINFADNFISSPLGYLVVVVAIALTIAVVGINIINH